LRDYNIRRLREFERARRQAIQNCVTGDVVFVVDSSGSIGIDHWTKDLQFICDVIDNLPVGPKDTHVAMTTYGNRAHIIFYLTNFTDSTSLKAAVKAAPFLDENTNTSGGIYVGQKVLLDPSNGGRVGAPKMMVVITDGASTYDKQFTVPYANEAKAAGTMVIAVGVGNQTDPAELKAIAGTSKSGTLLYFQADNYDMLAPIKDTLAHATCQVDIPANSTGVPTVAPPCGTNTTVCPLISCQNACQHGFNADKSGCLTCDCLPAPKVCP